MRISSLVSSSGRVSRSILFSGLVVGLVASGCADDSGLEGGSETTTGGVGDGPEMPDECSIEAQLQFVADGMSYYYLWKDMVPDVNVEDYEDPKDLVVAMRYPELDIWSSVKDKGLTNAWSMEGKFIGYGFSTRRDADDNVRLSIVEPNSPSSAAGLERGWIIKSVNGVSKEELDANGSWGDEFGPSEPGVMADFVFEDLEGIEHAATLTRDWIDSITVPVHGVYETPNGPVGYLLFTRFVDDAAPELEEAFGEFIAADVKRVIIDFRYNGGGSLSMTRYINNLTLGKRATGEVSYQLRHNENLAEEFDRTYLFEDLEFSMDLDQVIFLTTGTTKSASEAVINGLVPHTDVQLVGSRTAGKPVGTKNYEFCEQYLSPITFTLENSVGNSNYYEGFPADCEVEDDLLHAFGDPEEGMLAAALALAGGQGCPG